MKKFLLMLCLIMLNACSVSESIDYDYTPADGVIVFYGNIYAFTYGTEIEVGSMTWTRLDEISTGTYIYTSTVSYTDLDDGETVEFTYYMKVEGMSRGVALYSSATSYDSAKNSTSYQLYTYDITEEPEEYVSNDLPYY